MAQKEWFQELEAIRTEAGCRVVHGMGWKSAANDGPCCLEFQLRLVIRDELLAPAKRDGVIKQPSVPDLLFRVLQVIANEDSGMLRFEVRLRQAFAGNLNENPVWRLFDTARNRD